MADPNKRESAWALQRAMFDAVDEVGRASKAAGFDCDYEKGGVLVAARSGPELERMRAEYDETRENGFTEDDFSWLDADAFAERARIHGALGGIYSPHCAALQPAKLACGLASFLEARGVAVFEQSPVRTIEKGVLTTDRARIRADNVLRCTEGYTCRLPGLKRAILPLHSMMIATEPLPEPVWQQIGLHGRETFADPRRSVIYGQRTADDRLAFGSRGKYYFGSGIRDRFAADDAIFEGIQATLESLFPVLRQHRITHRWGGALGVPRDWRPSVGIDRASGLAWGGGYVGEGVSASNLAGRTLAELILERDSERVGLPLVGKPWQRWEPEPLRWLAVSAMLRIGESLDAAERRGRPAPRARSALFNALVRK